MASRGTLAAARDGLALLGVAFGAWQATILRPDGLTLADPGAYLRAGTALLHGGTVYVGLIGDSTAVSYAPPWIVLFAALTLLPPMLVQLLFVTGDFVALWYVAGSWRGVGYAMFWPWTVSSLLSGNIDLLIAAAIVVAWRRGTTWPLVFAAYAKVAPLLAIPLHSWRRSLIAVALLLAATLPWAWLWPQWVAYLLRQPVAVPAGIHIAWELRLPVALLLLAAVRRPWAAAVAVVIAMPSLYPPTSMVAFAAIRLWLDERAVAPAGRDHLAEVPANA